MKKALALLFFISASILAFSQNDFSDYQGLRNSGTLNEDFLMSSMDKFLSQKDTINKAEMTRGDQRVTEGFLLGSNYELDRYFFNGRILINDEVGNYVNQVLDELLKDEPELRSELRVYISRDPNVNALANDRGVILVNLGLFNKIRTEAELAFILAHEVTHYKKKHNLSSTLNTYKVTATNGSQAVRTLDGLLLRKHSYNRKLEFVADSYGAQLILDSDYSRKAILESFDVLKYSNRPYKNEAMEASWFEDDYLDLDTLLRVYTRDLFIPDTASIDSNGNPTKWEPVLSLSDSDDEDESDEFSNHPAIPKRIEALKEFLLEENTKSGSDFLVSEEQFIRCQQISRLELCRLFNLRGEYLLSMYHGMVALGDFPDNLYLYQSISDAFVHFAIEMNDQDDESKREGLYTTTYNFYDQLDDFMDHRSRLEISLLALANVRKGLNAHPEDASLLQMEKSMVYELMIHHGLKIKDNTVLLTKPDKWKKDLFQPYIDSVLTKEHYIELIASLQDNVKDHRENENLDERARAKKDSKIASALKKGIHMGINKAIVVNPFYARTDYRKSRSMDYEGTEAREEIVLETYEQAEIDHGIDLTILDVLRMGENDSEKLNDMMVLQDWIGNADIFSDNLYASANYAEMKKVMAKYNSRYVVLSGFAHNTLGKSWNILSIYYAAIPPPGNIMALYGSAKPHKESMFVYAVIDTEEGDVAWSESRLMPGQGDRVDLIKHSIYEFVRQLAN
jgi:beta-barrel assembly-enhancing protease